MDAVSAVRRRQLSVSTASTASAGSNRAVLDSAATGRYLKQDGKPMAQDLTPPGIAGWDPARYRTLPPLHND